MTAWDRVAAALAGRSVDYPPVSLWRHFPDHDQTAQQLATSTIQWQGLLGLDFIKLMPPGDYATIDWGARSEYRGAAGGTRETIHFPIQTVDDWARIEPVDPLHGFNGQMVHACGLVRDALGDNIPILQTIFSPLTIANKLSNGLVIEHLKTHPDDVHRALNVIKDVTIGVTFASVREGADGVFFASQCASSDMVTEGEYREFGVRYDLPVMNAIADAGSRFTLVHVHGQNTYFDLLASYDSHAINWHDRRVGPSISEVHRRYPTRALVAGIDEKAIATMSPLDADRQTRDALRQADGRRLLIGPGCVIPVATPEENLLAAVRAARR
jgi:uroporphyrinogen decarboxylase